MEPGMITDMHTNVTQLHPKARLPGPDMEASLRKAFERGEFTLIYQPQVSLLTNEIEGFEALLRCDSPALANTTIEQFLPVLEESGLILQVGEWVLRQACRDLKQKQMLYNKNYKVAVNLSLRQFADEGLPALIESILAETGVDPSCLELEITEDIFTDSVLTSMRTIRDVHALGVKFAIDDFGTGYSSLKFLSRLPFSNLKIDKSFTADIESDPDAAAIASAIIMLAHRLGLTVVAEGVETEGQLRFLQQNGCDLAQGYHFAKPAGFDELHRMISALQDDGHDFDVVRGVIL
jgi:EAL domain-containing protein (putative c-di-GMP-specific phosphodiesterase class I)